MISLHVPDHAERDDLGAFIGRVVRLDQMAVVRLQADGGRVTAWASTPFDVLATRSVHGTLAPAEVTTSAAGLLTALTVERATTVDPGAEGRWQALVPPAQGWSPVDGVPAGELAGLAERGLALAREHAGPLGPPASLLDQTVLTVTGGSGLTVKVPLRCIFALSGLGFLDSPGAVRISATKSWVRLDAADGAVVRRRMTTLPLLTA